MCLFYGCVGQQSTDYTLFFNPMMILQIFSYELTYKSLFNIYSNRRFHSLSEDQSVSLSGGGDGEMDVLFDLFKTDRTPDSDQVEETINMGKFLAVSSYTYQ